MLARKAFCRLCKNPTSSARSLFFAPPALRLKTSGHLGPLNAEPSFTARTFSNEARPDAAAHFRTPPPVDEVVERQRAELKAAQQAGNIDRVVEIAAACATSRTSGGPKFLPSWVTGCITGDQSAAELKNTIEVGLRLAKLDTFYPPSNARNLVIRTASNFPNECFRVFDELLMVYGARHQVYKSKDLLRALLQAAIFSNSVPKIERVRKLATEAKMAIDRTWLPNHVRFFLSTRVHNPKWANVFKALKFLDSVTVDQPPTSPEPAATTPIPTPTSTTVEPKPENGKPKRQIDVHSAIERIKNCEKLSEALDIFYDEMVPANPVFSVRLECYNALKSKISQAELGPKKATNPRAVSFVFNLSKSAMKLRDFDLALKLVCDHKNVLGESSLTAQVSQILSAMTEPEGGDLDKALVLFQSLIDTQSPNHLRPAHSAAANLLVAVHSAGRDIAPECADLVLNAAKLNPKTQDGYLEGLATDLIRQSQFSVFVKFFSSIGGNVPPKIFQHLQAFCTTEQGVNLLPIFYENVSRENQNKPSMHHLFAHAAMITQKWELFRKVLMDFNALKTQQHPTIESGIDSSHPQQPLLRPEHFPLYLLFPEKSKFTFIKKNSASPQEPAAIIKPLFDLTTPPYTASPDPFDQRSLIQLLLEVASNSREPNLDFLSSLFSSMLSAPVDHSLLDMVVPKFENLYNLYLSQFDINVITPRVSPEKNTTPIATGENQEIKTEENTTAAESAAPASTTTPTTSPHSDLFWEKDRLANALEKSRSKKGIVVWDSSSIIRCKSIFPNFAMPNVFGPQISAEDFIHVVPWTILNELIYTRRVYGARVAAETILSKFDQVVVPTILETATIAAKDFGGVPPQMRELLSPVDVSVIQVAEHIRSAFSASQTDPSQKSPPLLILSEDAALRHAASHKKIWNSRAFLKLKKQDHAEKKK